MNVSNLFQFSKQNAEITISAAVVISIATLAVVSTVALRAAAAV